LMQGSVHGHEVLRMMIEADRPFTRDSLQAKIAEHFGENARFHVCSSRDMRAGELIEFLETRGKLRSAGFGWRVDQNEICGDAG
jgi:probable metal-binding protein